MSKNTLYLVDGTSLCYRSFFAINNLSTSGGFPTGAIYGFYRTLNKLLSKYKPFYIGICFDVSRKTIRQEKFKEYKIQRPPSPEGLNAQMPLVKKLISNLGIKLVEKEGFEADDLIATLTQKALSEGLSVVIVSSDKDLFQLLEDEKVSVYDYNKDKLIDKKEFIKLNGFTPADIIDYLSLAGDPTDNIPGARGIGKVGAAKLIKEFGTIENIFKNIDKVKGKTKEMLEESKKNILLSKELVRLYHPKVGFSLKDLEVSEPDSEKIYKMFSELGFRSFLKDIPAPSADIDIPLKSGLPAGVSKGKNKELAFYIEGKDIFIFNKGKKCIYKENIAKAKSIFEDKDSIKVTHNLKEQIMSYGIKQEGLFFDVEIAAYLLDSALGDFSLENLASTYLNKHLSAIPAGSKPYFVYQLYELLSKKLKQEKMEKLFLEAEMPLAEVLADMQSFGVRVELRDLDKLLDEVDKGIEKETSQVFEIAGREFNLNSPKQLAGVLFEDLGIKPVKKTKTGFSTGEEVLDKLSSEYKIAAHILSYRYLNKLKTTYILPLIEEVKKNKGRLHTNFNQTVTQTGRLSSSSPNLQSIPVKGEFSSHLRKAFIPSNKDGYILSGDYSQIELRILAHLSGDEVLIKAFKEGKDIHSSTAGLLFGVEPESIDDFQRNVAKRVNFGIIYGMSSYGLAKELKISVNEAQNFIDDYFNRFSQVREYIDSLYVQAKDKGYVETILGRKRRLPEMNSTNMQLREFARRQAINAPVQGSCADLIKIAMVRIFKELKDKNFKTKLIIQIHDELIFDVAASELEEVSKLIRKNMESALELSVPVKVNLEEGKNWGQMERLR